MATATRERPILFKGEMVRKILSGEKTQTRRVVKRQPIVGIEPCGWSGTGWGLTRPDGGCSCRPVSCPYGSPGDRLWVRETWSPRTDVDPAKKLTKAQRYVRYRADADDLANEWHSYDGWKPSIHMPRWASRITLEITGVRVERLQEISEEDARAEGVGQRFTRMTWRGGFAFLWDQINGKRAPWASNPWVWVIEFKPT